MKILFWFRNDLRTRDNPALHAAVCSGATIMPIFIDDEEFFSLGKACRFWLRESLASLNESLFGKLSFYVGEGLDCLEKIIKAWGITHVFCNQVYEPRQVEKDKIVFSFLQSLSVEMKIFNGSLLWEPGLCLRDNGEPYKVFSAFYKHGCLKNGLPRIPLASHEFSSQLSSDPGSEYHKTKFQLGFDEADCPQLSFWRAGEQGAWDRLEHFIEYGLKGYKLGRDYPMKNSVSMLSPHLRWGEISPQEVWYMVKSASGDCAEDAEHFLRELAWREFSYYMLYHFPSLPYKNWHSSFDAFPWRSDANLLKAWQEGYTGYPIIDAGMRQLRKIGYMHNRVRMIVASFLVKNLLIHWQEGAQCFWNYLFDADLANNSASWQWVAGCGADAAPYFRIFNPELQSAKFDPEGVYIKTYIPELASVPSEYLSNISKANSSVLSHAGVKIGINYPAPIVDLSFSRARALAALKEMKLE